MGEIKIKSGKLTIRDRKTGEIVEEINIPEGEVIKFWKEEETDNWHRERFDRSKDGLVHSQIAQDIDKITKNVSYEDKNGSLKSKYNLWLSTLSPKPKTLQRKGDKRQTQQRNIYKNLFQEEFEKNKQDLEKFKRKGLFVYLCFYLRDRKYKTTDLDNYPKLILDALKPYIGDDSQITTLLLEKKQLYKDYNNSDLDFVENSLIIVAEENAKQDIIEAI